MPGLAPRPQSVLSSFVIHLSRRERYAVLSALRGPDAMGGHWPTPGTLADVKHLVTIRIRAIVFDDDPVFSAAVGPISHEEIEQVRKIIQYVQTQYPRPRDTSQQAPSIGIDHFLNHLQQAVDATARHPMWSGSAGMLIDALKGAALK